MIRKMFLALCLMSLPVVGCKGTMALAGPVCEGGKCALRAAKTVVVAPVKVARRAASLPGRAVRAARSR